MVETKKTYSVNEAFEHLKERYSYLDTLPDYREVIRYMDREFKNMPKKDQRELGRILKEHLSSSPGQVESLESAADFINVKCPPERL
jgi:hypothetical protein